MNQNIKLGELHKQSISELTGYSDSARLDADLILCHVLSIPRTAIITQDQMALEAEQIKQVQQLIEKRKQSYPIAYITGSRSFWDLDLKVTKDTLIPRPETELLVEMALSLYAEDENIQLLDLGTGSGAIAIAIAKARPNWNVVASDKSSAALSVARHNIEKYQLKNISLVTSQWFDDIPTKQKFDLILSNPPYIESNDPHLQQGDVQHEPRSALSSGIDGLDDIRLLIPSAYDYLKTKGWLWLEHGFDQAQRIKDLFDNYHYTNIKQILDLAGHTRISGGQLE